ncbi:MAG: TldD/PmbA family protein [Rhodobacteraceae bacterium]|jgi:PmbA protein|uniref:PmbA protein n=1 Tax=Salipiger profundus TaxID=1229727 RepID=A0A1U7D055_9RHOB|nr:MULTISPECIES: TldD/PmbA family protein [Salipiger]APX21456.1 PmbA protein [Salipiger profundus]MAB08863.1 TldD/PmbA family protein [Paracoccaceae bacterium]GGA02257.1 modulator protein [Salipiger profundus]SFC20059.1 PmbA protein [Salipiger profundus]
MARPLDTLTEALLAAAKAAGADSADALAVRGSSIEIDVRGGTLEQAERSEGTDLGLRVLLGKRVAVVSASDEKDETLTAMAERAVAMAREAPEDPWVGLADPDQLARDRDAGALEMYDPAPEPAPAELQQDAAEAEAAALGVAGIAQVQSASAGYGRRDVHLAATNGFSGGYTRSSRALSCVAIAGEGLAMERDYDGDSRTFQAELRSAQEIGRRAAERALERVNPRKPKTGAYPVLFDERISGSLIAHLLSAANGAAVARGASWLRGALGEEVLPPELSLIEDPHRPRISGSRPFDAEGLPTQRRAIVENGVLKSFTLDLANARKLGMAPTGNAARGTSGGPSPSPWNIALTQGEKSRADLIAEMGTGLIVTSMIGATINPNTGDYSRGAAGIWVENGQPAYPVSGVTIAGNLRDFLRRMTPANDARPWLSRVVPSLLVEGLTLAGE